MSDERDMSPALIPLDRAPFTFKTLQAIAKTEFVPAGLRGKTEAILACVLTGRELGLGPMESMRSIDIIDGKPSPTGEFMARRVFEAGHLLTVTEQTAEVCTVQGVRRENGVAVANMEFTFTIDMAKRAGLTNKSNWKHYPEAMLYWRAVSQLVRQFFPDVIAGISHLPDELGDGDWHEEPDSLNVQVEEDSVTVTKADDEGDQGEIEDAEIVKDEDEDAGLEDFEGVAPSGEGDRQAIEAVRQLIDRDGIEGLELAVLSTISTSARWLGGTIPDIESRTRFLCRAMEGLRLWEADSLHHMLEQKGHGHWGDLGTKAKMVTFSMGVVAAADKRVSEWVARRDG